MTPQQKATDLYREFYDRMQDHPQAVTLAKDFAMVAVQQIVKLAALPAFQIIFWREVKQEIEKI